jgi:hypothetical protein
VNRSLASSRHWLTQPFVHGSSMQGRKYRLPISRRPRLGAFHKAEIEKWRPGIKAPGIKGE